MNVMSYNAMTAHTMCEASCACLQAREFPDDKVLSPRCIVQIGLATQTHHALLCVCVCVCVSWAKSIVTHDVYNGSTVMQSASV